MCDDRRRAVFIRSSLLAMAFVMLIGCTVIPNRLKTREASWDGGAQNSGQVGWYTNSAGATFRLVTPHWRDRYNAMVADTGLNVFQPPLAKDEGLSWTDLGTNGFWAVDLEHLAKFLEMNQRRLARPPP